MKTHQPTQQATPINSSELFFGILMLIIIFMTSCNTSQASPKISFERSHIVQTQEEAPSLIQPQEGQMIEVRKQYSSVPIPLLVLLLLTFSSGVLTGSLYLVREIKK